MKLDSFEYIVDYQNDTDDKEYIKDFFPSEEEAIFALYEQLFGNINSVCKDTILNTMKYLIFSKSMDNQMEEIRHMTVVDVDVIHHRQVEKEVEQATKKLKIDLYREIRELLLK